MVARNVIKNLAVAEDILHGVGEVTQLRNGEVLTVHRVDIPVGIETVADLASVDPIANPRVRVGNTEFEYISGTWQERLVIAPYPLVSGLQLTERYNQVIKDGIIAKYVGTMPYTATGLENITAGDWQVIGGGGGGGGGLEYAVPTDAFTVGKSFFNPTTFELALSYDDGDSAQYVTFPLVPTSVLAESGGGGGGGGIIYEPPTGVFSVGDTLFNPDTFELSFSYNDGDSSQYVTFPLAQQVITPPAFDGITGGSSLGAGAPTFGGVAGNSLLFKSIVAGANVSLTETANSITIAASGGGGASTTLQNVGAGAGVWKATTLDVASLRTFTSANSSILVTQNADTINLQTATMPHTGITPLATASLLGRSSAGSGAAELISIGTNLTLSGGVLSASSGGATLNAALSSINALTPAADRLPYYTGAGSAALATFTALARTLVAQATGAQMLSQLGIGYYADANGTSLRIPIPGIGGIQICFRTGLASGAVTTALGSDFTSANVTWTYPQAFSTTPSVTATCGPGAFSVVGGTSSHTTSTANVKAQASISDGGGGFFNLIAIGTY